MSDLWPRAGAREVLTPEGVPLAFPIAGLGDRGMAFAIDLLCVTAITGTVSLLAWLATGGDTYGGWIGAFSLLAVFAVRNFWFVWFEARWQGQTPGKRLLRLRVLDRHGGPLSLEAVLARNVTRELELFLPASTLASPDTLWPGATGASVAVAFVWLAVFALMPLFNRERLRVGDLVGGTIVVVSPRAVLQDDLSAAARACPVPIGFTPAQLEVYGIYELHVLEDLLRQDTPARAEAIAAVADRIRKSIGWAPPEGEVAPEPFLRAFYAAQRAHLERKLLFGTRQERKRGGVPLRPGPV